MPTPQFILIVGGSAAGALLLLGGYVVYRRVTNRVIVSAALATVLIGYFALWVILAEPARAQPWLAIMLFAGATGLFRLMSRFENPPPPGARPTAHRRLSTRRH
ncbi:hypothetical protein OG563_47165 [Nocardia vinacea]|uniref:Uncharacterized protein n=1 Tax=Nocardia vinacea TaxID=96468 RepID=A0ABZ1YXQ9_9NOCA|nr:hypothetical protein [Nocardia vinacea]